MYEEKILLESYLCLVQSGNKNIEKHRKANKENKQKTEEKRQKGKNIYNDKKYGNLLTNKYIYCMDSSH